MLLTEQIVRAEYLKLDKKCNIDTTGLPIIFFSDHSKTVGECCFKSPAIPSRIRFNLQYLNYMPDVDCIDVVRHEYAHAAAAMKYGPMSLVGDAHGPCWQTICRIVNCRPYPYTYNLTVLEPLVDNDGDSKEKERVQCCRCGYVSYHGEDSRIVKILRAGLTSWNYVCPQCGNPRFRLDPVSVPAKVTV